jgi:N-acetyl-anhydromuramyl-L-alanine amidase AmpD
MRTISHIIIHCAATPNGKPFTVQDIDSWHRERGFHRFPQAMADFNPGLTSIGYHYVIYTDGTVHVGRHPDEIGAHAVGYNKHSLGICLIGNDHFSPAQWEALNTLVMELLVKYGGAYTVVCGHRDLPNVRKSCPGFDVTGWQRGGHIALADHTITAKA